jgi:hypothetical protein
MNKSLLNMMVRVLPDLDIGPIVGHIVLIKESDRNAIIIKLITPFDYGGHHYEYLIATPRKADDSFHTLLKGASVFCSVLKLPSDRISSDDPFDTSWWRGGAAFIGDVEPA